MDHMTTVEEVLRQGGSVDDVMEIVRHEIEKVNAKLQAEEAERKAKEAAKKNDAMLDRRRKELTAAVMNYMIALGVVDPTELDDIKPEEVETALKEMETYLIAQVKFLKMLKDAAEKHESTATNKITDPDFENFLKSFAKTL